MRTSELLECAEHLAEGINDPHLYKAVFMAGGPGSGKCLGLGVPVMLYDGTSIPAGDVKVGDVLMGDDSTPRNVVRVSHEHGPMVRVTPVKGDAFECGESHIMVLDVMRRTKRGGVERLLGYETVEMDIAQYMDGSARFKSKAKLVRTSVDFAAQDVPVDPYFLGLWLGDGHKHAAVVTTEDDEILEALYDEAEAWGLRLTPWDEDGNGQGAATAYALSTGRSGKRNPLLDELRSLGVAQPTGFERGESRKHVPWVYKRNSRAVRLQVLAGLIDSDGNLSNGCVDFVQKVKQVAEDFVWLARSVGMAAYMVPKPVNGETYWRVSLSGEISKIPTRVPRKQAGLRRQVKSVLRTGFVVEQIGDGEYCSIETDGNHRHLLGDFTVTHNSFIARNMFSGMGLKFLNSDDVLERLLKKKGLSLDLRQATDAQMLTRDQAKKLTAMRQSGWVNGMLGLVIDGTGKNYDKIKKAREYLQSIGYDTGMVFVNTSFGVAKAANEKRKRKVPDAVVKKGWEAVQHNLGKFQKLFGSHDFIIVDNSKRLGGSEAQEFGKNLRRSAMGWLNKPLRNDLGVGVLQLLRQTGGKVISDLPVGINVGDIANGAPTGGS